MKFNNFEDNFPYHQKSSEMRTKIIPFQKKMRVEEAKSKNLNQAKIIVFPTRYLKGQKNSRYLQTLSKSGWLFWTIAFALILVLLLINLAYF